MQAERINLSPLRAYLSLRLYYAKKKGDSKKITFYSEKIEDFDYIRQDVLVKYFTKELFLYFFVCFLFFFVVFFVNQILLLAETILRMRVPVTLVIRLITYCLPGIVAQSAPFATLVGFLMCLGRMVTDNEILILRASGQRYSLILKPVIMMGLFISIFSFVMNDYFLPLGTLNYNKLYHKIIVSNPAVELESQSIKRMKDSTLILGDVEGTNVSDLVLFDNSGNKQRFIVAKNSNVKKSQTPGIIMSLEMQDPLVLILDKLGDDDFESVDAENLTLNVFEDAILSTSSKASPREMTSYDLAKKIKGMKEDKSISKKQRNNYKLEFNKKFSIPFGSIFFAILAFPLALIFGRKDGQTLGLIFGIIISVLYWASTILGQMFGLRGGYNGFWMMWTPNLLIGFIGIILYLRLKRK